MHSHIAKTPTPPQNIKAEVPEQVSAIVMRLLEKNAEGPLPVGIRDYNTTLKDVPSYY